MQDWRDENKGPEPVDAHIAQVRFDFSWVADAAIATVRDAMTKLTFRLGGCCGDGK